MQQRNSRTNFHLVFLRTAAPIYQKSLELGAGSCCDDSHLKLIGSITLKQRDYYRTQQPTVKYGVIYLRADRVMCDIQSCLMHKSVLATCDLPAS